MKQCRLFVLVLVFLFFSGSLAMAGSIDWLSQQSAEYIRLLSRNASLEGADIANYNPAGTAFLNDGFHVQLGLYSLLKYYDIEYEGKTYESDEPSPAVPFLYGIYKKDRFAGFASFTVPAGGGSLVYEEGIPLMVQSEALIGAAAGLPASFVTFKDGEVEGSSMYLAGTLGGSFAINDKFAMSLAARYISAEKTVEGYATYSVAGSRQHLEVDTVRTASGVGAIIGFDYRYNERLNVALRYETVTELEFEADTEKNDLQLANLNDGDKERLDLPPVLGLGFSYQLNETLNLSMSAHYFFITQVKDEEDTTNPLGSTVVNGYDDDYNDGFEITAGADYVLLPNLRISGGYQYTVCGGSDKTYRDLDYSLDSHFVGAGFKWGPMENTDIAFGVGRVFYIEDNDESGTVTYNKSVWIFALSGEMRF